MTTDTLTLDLDALTFDAAGLIPVIVQEVATGAVRMMAWANGEALERTVATREAWFWSRSRQGLWKKGETSGNTLAVVSLHADCDGDTLLMRVDPNGPTCHRGERSCFDAPGGEAVAAHLELGWLDAVLAGRAAADPAESYTARLLAAGAERIARKVGEEATETVIAALAEAHDSDGDGLAGEAADLLYHLLLLLRSRGVPAERLAAELRRRHIAPPAARPAKPEDLS
ncbi:MAG: bifunctional phosphoribosyl-AMP cyclohydrolase/phosphoribosyl-ATP diphosphatase HisIE [Acidobacteriota bacterium]